MPDREKVKKELLELNSKAYGLWVHDQKNEFLAQIGNVTDDVLALLKEQEAVKPEFFKGEWRCGVCSHVVLTYCFDPNEGDLGRVMANYCPSCGRSVKWE